ncbi:MAG: CvpA family protein [Clostridia bacterium]|nr:CvpA family protein [Clostridia bacterium]
MDIIVLVVTVIFVLFILFEFLRGIRRGVYRQALHAAFTLSSAVIAFFVARGLTDLTLKLFGTDTIAGVLNALQAEGAIVSERFVAGELAEYLSAIEWLAVLPVSTLVVPIVFTVSFIIINLLSKIVFVIVRALCRVPDTKDDVDKMFFGAMIGAVEGLMVAMIIFLPVFNAVGIIDEGVDAIREVDDGQYTENLDGYDETLGVLADAPVVKMTNLLGGRAVVNEFSKIEIDGESVVLRDELITLTSVIFEYASLDDGLSELDENEKSVLRSATEKLTSSIYLSTIVADVLSDSSRIIEDGVINIDSDADPSAFAIHGITEVFVSATKYNLKEIFDTILDAYFYMSDQKILPALLGEESVDGSVSIVDENGKNKITGVSEILNKCEYTRPLVTVLSKMMLTAVFDEYSSEHGDITKTYEDVKESFANVIAVKRDNYETVEEYKAARQEALNNVFLEHGVDNADPEVLEDICDYLDDEYPDLDSVDDERFNDIIFSGISYYTEKMEREYNEDTSTEQ